MMIIENETMSPVNENVQILVLNPEEETSRELNFHSEIRTNRSCNLSKQTI